MIAAISTIKEEHRSIAELIKGLQTHVSEVRAGRLHPDFDLVSAMFDYIQAFPERVHHPKEDACLFRVVRMRAVEARTILDELEAQHAQGVKFLADLREELVKFRDSGDAAEFARALDAYAQFECEHMCEEEATLLPLAERHLTAHDWEAIEAAFESNRTFTW